MGGKAIIGRKFTLLSIMSRRHLSQELMLRAVGMLEAGRSQREVAAAINSNQSVIRRLWQRYRLTGNTAERHSGRYRKTTQRQDRFLQTIARREPTATARQLVERLRSEHNVVVSTQTARRRLHETRLKSRRPLRFVALRRGNRARRLQWARVFVRWSEDQWTHVLFSDESRIGFHSDSRRIHVWRAPGRRERLRCVQEVHPYQGGTIMVWAGIRVGGRTDLVLIRGTMTAEKYCHEVVEPIVAPLRQQLGRNFMFMQDNARSHTARAAINAFREHDITLLDWPPQSCDMNPIEHAWDLLKRKAFEALPQNLITEQDLFLHLSRTWNRIPQATFDNLILSMPRRCRALTNALGGPTDY